MEPLNYHHLYYFWHVSREGSVTKAADRLGVSQPTVSGQLSALEKAVGKPLFTRVGRGLVLSDTGRLISEYADEIFRIGNELTQALQSGRSKAGRLVVGVADAVPKLLIHRLFAPVYEKTEPIRLVVIEGKPDYLAAELAQNALDVIVTDAPIPATIRVKAFHHSLGDCGTSFFAAPKHAAKLKATFPESLQDSPFFLPTPDAAKRRSLESWFASQHIMPVIRGEFADSALIKELGRHGIGAYALPTAVERDVLERYGSQLIGRVTELRQEYFAVTVARRVTNPILTEVFTHAKDRLFADGV
ncbi:MAG: LysR family transcriptional regulator [Gemmataceae bacterium]